MISQETNFPIDLESLDSCRVYRTNKGAAFCGDSLELLKKLPDESVNLVMTSPPFALQRKKEYGNKNQSEYIDWLADFARLVYQKLKSDGSFVLDLGGAYEKGKPVRSLYNFRIPIYFCDEIGFFLAEDFYWFNPSKLPSPIEWVNKRKIRAKDSVNTVWWFSKSEFPKSDVTKVLTEYSPRMKKLLEDPEKFYDPKKRPSGHDISTSFGKNNGGAIPSNLLQIPNSESNSQYLRGCNALGLKPHPARFPGKLPEFFIRLLTEPGDLVVDIFAGSNTTGFVAEQENRYWIAFEQEIEYLATSCFRFMQEDMDEGTLKAWHQDIVRGHCVDVLFGRLCETNSAKTQ
ncbi:MAG: site-specific DNA-methyltransferase [Roseofilum sp. SBFL]|nr:MULTISPECIES: site-specific DNA-methyltransferase [unclassified Roseofilum]MBP0013211.1 site-specific DNA-methyltransferase [Roseofilum sp. SID3]MBP0022937.1 site-specific DNA-methyltransferase [Roseofilum sp. SID2]MBP0036205.1 site-specific DNA-methyltransferase [Roseofilum sp. SID1]MBP0042897.1 site-specific DNA-methyltransferase [Roseofilum sp. SBFL]